MIRKRKDGIQWLEFTLFQEFPFLVHGVFLRHGGVSPGSFASLNLSTSTGDSLENVEQNYASIRSLLHLSQLISAKQVHSDRIVSVSSSAPLEECDGLMTQEVGSGLLIKHADCQAALFFDPVTRAIANVHAGWRGNVQGIYSKTIQKMVLEYGSKPEDLLVGISPSLGPEVAEFKHYKTEFPEWFWDFQVKPNHFDLWAIAKTELLQSGVLEEHIEIAGICTYTQQEDFFSHRRDKLSGRNATIIGINSNN